MCLCKCKCVCKYYICVSRYIPSFRSLFCCFNKHLVSKITQHLSLSSYYLSLCINILLLYYCVCFNIYIFAFLRTTKFLVLSLFCQFNRCLYNNQFCVSQGMFAGMPYLYDLWDFTWECVCLCMMCSSHKFSCYLLFRGLCSCVLLVVCLVLATCVRTSVQRIFIACAICSHWGAFRFAVFSAFFLFNKLSIY